METTDTLRPPRRLARPRDGRWLGGVAAALGEYFDLSPTIYRIAFVALALAGGTGLLLYLAAWLVIPDERDESSVAERVLRERADRPSRAIGLALLAFVAILALSSAHWWPTPGNLWLALALGFAAFVWWEASPRGAAAHAPSGPAGEHVTVRGRSLFGIAVGSLIAGAGVVALLDTTGAWHPDWRIVLGAAVLLTGGIVAAGAALGQRVAGAAGVGVILVAALALVLTIRVPVFAGWGDRTSHPQSLTALGSDYRFGIGRFTLDLSDVPFGVGLTHVDAELGMGKLRVVVPGDVTVRVTGHATGGDLRLLGRERSGGSVDESVTDVGSRPARVLVLDTKIGFGDVEVVRG